MRDDLDAAGEMSTFGGVLDRSMVAVMTAHTAGVPLNQTLNMTAVSLWTNMTHYGTVLQHILEAAHDAILNETDAREGVRAAPFRAGLVGMPGGPSCTRTRPSRRRRAALHRFPAPPPCRTP